MIWFLATAVVLYVAAMFTALALLLRDRYRWGIGVNLFAAVVAATTVVVTAVGGDWSAARHWPIATGWVLNTAMALYCASLQDRCRRMDIASNLFIASLYDREES